MNPSDYRCIDAGRIVRSRSGYDAFVPAPLPPTVVYDGALVMRLSRADAALSELSGLARNLPSPHLLIAPYVRKEAVLSSMIEGSQVSLSDLFKGEIEEEHPSAPGDAERREVQNYVVALEHGVARLRGGFPLSLRLIRETHERLMDGVRSHHATPGEFRRSQNWIGPPGSNPQDAPYVPPPPTEMMECLYEWERFVHQRDAMPELIQCALIHEHFEAIHPFVDGNGRIGRLLITLFLLERQRLSQPLLYLSAYIDRHRQDYYRLLQGIRTDCDWPDWLRFFLRGVALTARHALRQAAALHAIREEFRFRLRETPRAVALLDALFVNPYVTASRAAHELRVTAPTAREAIRVLETSGMLRRASERAWRRIYVAEPILDAIEQPFTEDDDSD